MHLKSKQPFKCRIFLSNYDPNANSVCDCNRFAEAKRKRDESCKQSDAWRDLGNAIINLSDVNIALIL